MTPARKERVSFQTKQYRRTKEVVSRVPELETSTVQIGALKRRKARRNPSGQGGWKLKLFRLSKSVIFEPHARTEARKMASKSTILWGSTSKKGGEFGVRFFPEYRRKFALVKEFPVSSQKSSNQKDIFIFVGGPSGPRAIPFSLSNVISLKSDFELAAKALELLTADSGRGRVGVLDGGPKGSGKRPILSVKTHHGAQNASWRPRPFDPPSL